MPFNRLIRALGECNFLSHHLGILFCFSNISWFLSLFCLKIAVDNNQQKVHYYTLGNKASIPALKKIILRPAWTS